MIPMLNRTKMHEPPKPRTPPVTPLTPDSMMTSNTQITSLQSLISHHYLNVLKPVREQTLTSQSFSRNSSANKQNSLARHFLATSTNNSIIVGNTASSSKRLGSALSRENDFSAKSLSDFAIYSGSCGSFSQLNNNMSSSKNSSKMSSPRKNSSWKPGPVPKHLAEENERRKIDAVKTKKDIHNKIIEIGESIYDKIQSNSQNQYEIQLLEKEKELKRFYALEMDSSMEKEKSHFQQKLEGIRARMKADYEKVLQEKAYEIETFTQNVSNEQLEAYKLESRKKLLDTIDRMNAQHAEERAEAVDRAVKEERAAMELKLDAQKKMYEKQMDELNESWHGKFKQSQTELRSKLSKDAEKQSSLHSEQIKFEKNKEIEEIRETYEKELDTLRSDYRDKKNGVAQMRSKIDVLNYENEQLKEIVQELRQELKSCIEHFSMRNRVGENGPKSILKNPKGLKITFNT